MELAFSFAALRRVWRQTSCVALVSLALTQGIALAGSYPVSDAKDFIAPEPAVKVGSPASRKVETARTDKGFVVVAGDPLAAEAGASVLRMGGTAADAAAAALLALNVVEPQSSGLGGGGFFTVYDAKTKHVRIYDGRETAPASARADMFVSSDGTPLPFDKASRSGNAVGVPGLVAALELMLSRHGALPRKEVYAPAIRLAEQGVPLSHYFHAALAADPAFLASRAARRYLNERGEILPEGTLLRFPELAGTLRLLADKGEEVFYHGPIARMIAESVRHHPGGAGGLAESDLAAYHALEREPLCFPFSGYTVCGPPPPSSGTLALAEILGIYERAAAKQGGAKALSPARSYFLVAEAERVAFADRAAFAADPAFVAVPVARLTDPSYLQARADEIGEKAAAVKGAAKTSPEGDSTTHVVVGDEQGNVVSVTASIERGFGSAAEAEGTGFLLNNQLTDFNFKSEGANIAAPGKRPRSAMCPVMVFDKSGRPVFAVGSPGGARIIAYVAQTLVDTLARGMTPAEAEKAPRFSAMKPEAPEAELETDGFPEEIKTALQAAGYSTKEAPMNSGVNSAVFFPGGGAKGVADPRRNGFPVAGESKPQAKRRIFEPAPLK